MHQEVSFVSGARPMANARGFNHKAYCMAMPCHAIFQHVNAQLTCLTPVMIAGNRLGTDQCAGLMLSIRLCLKGQLPIAAHGCHSPLGVDHGTVPTDLMPLRQAHSGSRPDATGAGNAMVLADAAELPGTTG